MQDDQEHLLTQLGNSREHWLYFAVRVDWEHVLTDASVLVY